MKHKDLKRSPYARILLNAKLGRGVRLSASEVWQMSTDESIRTCGELDLEGVLSEDDL